MCGSGVWGGVMCVCLRMCGVCFLSALSRSLCLGLYRIYIMIYIYIMIHIINYDIL